MLPQVRREAILALRGTIQKKPLSVADLALQHDGKDRWYLEALGIGATEKTTCVLQPGRKKRRPVEYDCRKRYRLAQPQQRSLAVAGRDHQRVE